MNPFPPLPKAALMDSPLWIVLFLALLLAAVVGPVATLRYLALLERGKARARKKSGGEQR